MSATSPPFAEGGPAHTTARILLELGAVKFSPDKPFVFTSGRRSPVYIDCRRLISFPRARAKLMDLAVETILAEAGYERFDAVAGEEGVPAAHFLDDRPGQVPVHGRVVHHEYRVAGNHGRAG